MNRSSNTNLYELIRNLGVIHHKKRQEFLCDLVESVIKSRSVIFSQIADRIESESSVESIERRIQSFFQKSKFDYLSLGTLLMSFVHHDKLLISIDRTEWDFGKTQINILCAVVSIGKMAVPVYFEMLDNKSGNSNASNRIDLFKSIIQIVGLNRIDLIVMDREFIGNKWLLWLKKNNLNFCVRVPKSHKITLLDGTVARAEELLEDKKSYSASEVVVDNTIVNLSLGYGADGELLYLIGSIPSKELKQSYKKRWAIEVFFQALKARGFNMELSCLRNIEKYRKLFAVVSIAYTISWATGIEDGRVNPVKRKKHGYPQYSVFRRGLNLIRKFFKNKVCEPFELAIQKAHNRIKLEFKTIG